LGTDYQIPTLTGHEAFKELAIREKILKRYMEMETHLNSIPFFSHPTYSIKTEFQSHRDTKLHFSINGFKFHSHMKRHFSFEERLKWFLEKQSLFPKEQGKNQWLVKDQKIYAHTADDAHLLYWILSLLPLSNTSFETKRKTIPNLVVGKIENTDSIKQEWTSKSL
jgi:hypothetical protein